MRDPTVLVLMGVSGCGKSTVGRLLARRVGCAFHDADNQHSAMAVAKMRRGTPLDDRDRAAWLTALRRLVARHVRSRVPAVLACSALKERYRQRLRVKPGAVGFVHLEISPATAARRLRRRRGHFFPAALIPSQFAALEPPRDALRLPAVSPPARLAARIARRWRRHASS
ncbi:MAG: AAA family ATPase [Verrucomicrobiae bacterium]|nr:AAA family ATPase [Verrucomicrobiae bacterium]